jgi:hypothetical protein
MNKLKVYIPTCDQNIFVIKYFQYFFNKYWDSNLEVKILGFSPPTFKLADNFEFISLGSNQVGGAKNWTTYLINYFTQLDCETFIFGIDDFMIARPVDQKVFEAAQKLFESDMKIGRVDLQPLQFARDPSDYQFAQSVGDIEFFKLNQIGATGRNLYKIAGAFSIWNRSWFLQNMKTNWSPWDWEILGSKQAENDGYDVLGSYDRFAIKKSELLSKQWPSAINTLALRKIDVIEMTKMVSANDRLKKFKSIGEKKFGYREFGGKNWIEEIYGP